MTNFLIIFSSLLLIISSIPYALDIVRKKTKPRLVSWFTWGILTLIAAFASLSDHQTSAVVLGFSSTFTVFTIFALGLIYDGDTSIAKFDIVCQIFAIIGFVLWMIFNSPSIAIIFAIVIDVVASLPTIKHSWQKPYEETWITFLGAGLGAGLAVIAAKEFTITGVANPLYIVLINGLIVAVILIRKRQLGQKSYT